MSEDFTHSSPFGVIEGRDASLVTVRENAEVFFSPQLEVIDVIKGDGKYAVQYLVNGNPTCDCIYAPKGEISKIYSYYHYGEKPSS